MYQVLGSKRFPYDFYLPFRIAESYYNAGMLNKIDHLYFVNGRTPIHEIVVLKCYVSATDMGVTPEQRNGKQTTV